jgi:hypothetical protein
MDNFRKYIRSLLLLLVEFLLKLYPPGFRRQFYPEIKEIVLSRVREREKLGWMAWLAGFFREITGLVPSIFQECWHELRSQKERAMVLEPYLQRGGPMKTIAYIRWADPPFWVETLANLLPLWLIILAFTVGSLGIFLLAIAAMIFLLWLGWFTPELILYSLFPFATLVLFEEMPDPYSIPFLLLCAIILTVGIIGYRLSLHRDWIGFGWLTLVVFFIGTYLLASHANQNYWQMTGNETPWLVLFFSP